MPRQQRLAHGPWRALDPTAVDQPSLPVVTIDGHTVMSRPVQTRVVWGRPVKYRPLSDWTSLYRASTSSVRILGKWTA